MDSATAKRSADKPAALRMLATFALARSWSGEEFEMPNDRPSLSSPGSIGAGLCAAVVLIALLIAGDVAGPRVAMNNLAPITAW